MAFSFAKKYNTERLFDIDTTDFDYMSLEELWASIGEDPDCPIEVRGIYINTKGNFDDAPVVAIDGRYVNLPSHLTQQCRAILEDKAAIKAINAGTVAFKIRPYYKKKYDRECYTIEWVDI